MKKVLFLSLLAGLFVSCAKEQTCKCSVTHKESAEGYSFEKKYEKEADIKATEGNAKDACEDFSHTESFSNDGINYTITQACDID